MEGVKRAYFSVSPSEAVAHQRLFSILLKFRSLRWLNFSNVIANKALCIGNKGYFLLAIDAATMYCIHRSCSTTKCPYRTIIEMLTSYVTL